MPLARRDGDDPGLPPRLIAGEGAQAELLRRYVRARPPTDAAAAWDHLVPRLGRAAGWSRWRLGLLTATAGALAGALVVLLIRNPPSPAAPEGARLAAPAAVTPPRAIAVVPAPAGPPERVRVAVGAERRDLPVGALDLGEAHADLAPSTRARGRSGRRGLEIELLAGHLGLQVPASPRRVAVVVGEYRFTVAGAVFTLDRDGAQARLAVQTGQVAVRGGPRGEVLATLSAGQSWNAPPHGQLAAEIAAYQQAREASDPQAALTAFLACRRRFPQGGLRAEVDLSIVELLPRLGRFQQALDESAAILATATGRRRAELQVLRGNVLRDGLHDLPRALAEFNAAGSGSGPAADAGAFLAAAVLDQQGRRVEAAAAYRAYLGRVSPARATEARARLAALQSPAQGAAP